MELSAYILFDSCMQLHDAMQKRRIESYSRVQMWTPDARIEDGHVLYLAPAGKAPVSGNSRVHVLEGHDEIQLAHIVADLNACIADYAEWYERALKMVLTHASLEDLLDHCATKLENPIAVFDNSMTLLASAGQFEGPIEGTIWELVKAGSQDLTFYSPRERTAFSESISRASGPYRMRPEADAKHEYLSSHIKVHGQPAGHIGLVDINKPFTPGQVELVRIVTELVRFYLENNDLYLDAAQQDDNLIVTLLRGAPPSEEVVGLYLRQRGWTPADTCQVAVFTSMLELEAVNEMLPFARHVASVLEDSITVMHDDAVVSLVRAGDDADALARAAGKLLPSEGMCCGLSALFTDFSHLAAYYQQARLAGAWARLHEVRCACFRDVQADIVMATLADALGRRVACDPAILALWNDGGAAGRELVRSLNAYLLSGGNIALAARRLYLHRNTLIYRMGKVSEILGVDLAMLEECHVLYYLLSCQLAMHNV